MEKTYWMLFICFIYCVFSNASIAKVGSSVYIHRVFGFILRHATDILTEGFLCFLYPLQAGAVVATTSCTSVPILYSQFVVPFKTLWSEKPTASLNELLMYE